MSLLSNFIHAGTCSPPRPADICHGYWKSCDKQSWRREVNTHCQRFFTSLKRFSSRYNRINKAPDKSSHFIYIYLMCQWMCLILDFSWFLFLLWRHGALIWSKQHRKVTIQKIIWNKSSQFLFIYHTHTHKPWANRCSGHTHLIIL